MPETTPLIKAALNLRVGAGFDVYVILSTYHGKQIKLSVIVRQLRRGGVKTMDNKQVNKAPQKSARLVLQAVTAIARSNANSLCRGLLYEPKVPTQLKK